MSDKLAGGILAGSTSVSVDVVLRSTTDNTEVTGKAYTDITAAYWRQGAAPVSITPATLAAITTAWATGGFKEADSAKSPGSYRLDVPDAAFASGVDWVEISVVCTGCYTFKERYALTTNVVQTGDNYARIGAAGAGLTALAQASLWTSARAGYLDNVNLGGLVSSSAEVLAIQNNTSSRFVVPSFFERPDTSSTAFLIHLYLYDDVGNMEAPDSTPTITVTNQAGTDRSGGLSAPTTVGTGHYKWTYTVASTDTIEQLFFEATIVEGSATRLAGASAWIVDTTAVDFTANDRTTLNGISTTVTTNLNATVSSRSTYAGGAVASVTAPVTAILADGVAHGGTLGSSTATLALKQINISTDSGNAVGIQSTDVGAQGVYIQGELAAAYLYSPGNSGAFPYSAAVVLECGNGPGAVYYSDNSYGFYVYSEFTDAAHFEAGAPANGDGLALIGDGTGVGCSSTPAATGFGAVAEFLAATFDSALHTRDQGAVTDPTLADALYGSWVVAFGADNAIVRTFNRKGATGSIVRAFALDANVNTQGRS